MYGDVISFIRAALHELFFTPCRSFHFVHCIYPFFPVAPIWWYDQLYTSFSSTLGRGFIFSIASTRLFPLHLLLVLPLLTNPRISPLGHVAMLGFETCSSRKWRNHNFGCFWLLFCNFWDRCQPRDDPSTTPRRLKMTLRQPQDAPSRPQDTTPMPKMQQDHAKRLRECTRTP